MVERAMKSTPAGIIPKAWDIVELSDVLVSLEAGVSVNSDENNYSGCFVLKTSSVNGGKFMPNEKKNVVAKDCSRVKCPVVGDSIIISRMNTPQLVGECGYVEENMANCYLPDRLWLARNVKRTEYDFRWLSYVLSYGMYRDAIRSSATGTSNSMKNISKENIRQVIIPKPSLGEQKAIAKVLSDIDNLINNERKLVSKLRDFKIAQLQAMFPKAGATQPEVRLPGFTDAWEQRKLGEAAEFSKGSGYSKSDIQETGTPLILYGRLYTKYELVISDVDTFTKAKPGSVYSKGGEVIVPASGETAEDISIAAVVEKPGVLLGGDLNIVSPSSTLDAPFLALTISNGRAHDNLSKRAQGKSVVHLHNDDLQTIDISLPSSGEQKAIGNFFRQLDNLITLHQRKLEKYENLKQGMMSELLTGKIRLV
jgi:type I restriction enzyme S subunit